MTLNAIFNDEKLKKIEKLYLEAFPEEERKPFGLIVEKCGEDLTEILSIDGENGEFYGLAVIAKSNDMILLAFFAVSPEYRGQGIGSKALKLLFDRYEGKRFLLEIENTNAVCDNLQERKRRKNFYLSNSMTSMPYIVNLLGVEMEILTYNCNVNFNEYHSIYKNVFGEKISDKILLVSGTGK